MTNYISAEYGYGERENFLRQQFTYLDICIDAFINAISKDKKNRGNDQLGLILPDQKGKPSKIFLKNDERFYNACCNYLTRVRAA